jgi:formamidopyrimidine-DNA glycosylase
MPELPDVEVNRRYLDATALHQPVSAVRVGGGKNRRVLEGVSPQGLGKKLAGRSFDGTRRHGKYCFAALSGDGHVVFHFGMTGLLRYYENEPEDLDHVRVRFEFENGHYLAFVDQRLLGGVALTGDPEKFVREKNLGPDALDGLDENRFDALMEKSGAMIKSLLTDQRKVAGVGNVYADEILFQAGVPPTAAAGSLGRSQRRRLFKALKRVLTEAIEAGADPERMPGSYLLPVRREDGPCPHCGAELKKIAVQGRGTFYCPACQEG